MNSLLSSKYLVVLMYQFLLSNLQASVAVPSIEFLRFDSSGDRGWSIMKNSIRIDKLNVKDEIEKNGNFITPVVADTNWHRTRFM
jgi:hypothetical protein